jgi:hypothetical protein
LGISGTFGKGDIVGAGLYLKTGQGFCTLNGKILNMGEYFQDVKLWFLKRANKIIGSVFELPRERLMFGKLYPCVRLDSSDKGTGLRLSVNLDQSTGHPFKCQRSST